MREQLGTKARKRWLKDPNGELWLFKPRTLQEEPLLSFYKGDDWAEKVAAEVAHRLAIPAARVELAVHESEHGIISGRISGGRDLVHGNEILEGFIPGYDPLQYHAITGYTLEAIMGALTHLEALPPPGTHPDASAASVFAQFLSLDALCANTDRHHENWGILRSAGSGELPLLAPTFDHASSLGFQLSDEKRERYLDPQDPSDISRFATRGRSRHFVGRPSLLTLAKQAWATASDAMRQGFLEDLELLEESALEAVVAEVPALRMSQPARMFATELLKINRRRLLDGLS